MRGGIIDIFPVTSDVPIRIELWGDEIDSIRIFDPETQRTTEKIERVSLLPAREFPLDEAAVKRFRRAYRERIEGDAALLFDPADAGALASTLTRVLTDGDLRRTLRTRGLARAAAFSGKSRVEKLSHSCR